MPYVGSDFSTADPAVLEIDIYSFDWINDLNPGETILGNGSTIPASGLWVLSVVTGSDPAVNTHIIGSPTLSGSIVSQVIGQLVGGVKYLIQVTIYTSNNRTLTAYSHVTCTTPA